MIRTTTLAAALVAFSVPALATPPGAAPSAEQVRPLLIGAEVPAVTLKTAQGEPYDLAVGVKKKPTVLVFYRGGW